MNKPKHNLKYLKDRRQSLRNNGTIAEAMLWTQLKGKQLLGRKFRRQHSIGNYIVDLFCYSEQLIIELDGGIHNEGPQAVSDGLRSEYLQNLGYRILRFDNDVVINHMDRVLEEIKRHFSTED